MYLEEKNLKVEIMSRGFAWLDTGTPEALFEASTFIQAIENRQGLKVACLEEIAFNQGWLNAEDIKKIVKPISKSSYNKYLLNFLNKN